MIEKEIKEIEEELTKNISEQKQQELIKKLCKLKGRKKEPIDLKVEFKEHLYRVQNKQDPIALSLETVIQLSLDYSNIEEFNLFMDWFKQSLPLLKQQFNSSSEGG